MKKKYVFIDIFKCVISYQIICDSKERPDCTINMHTTGNGTDLHGSYQCFKSKQTQDSHHCKTPVGLTTMSALANTIPVKANKNIQKHYIPHLKTEFHINM